MGGIRCLFGLLTNLPSLGRTGPVGLVLFRSSCWNSTVRIRLRDERASDLHAGLQDLY